MNVKDAIKGHILRGILMPELISGQKLAFRGAEYTLKVVSYAGKKTRILLADRVMMVEVNREMPFVQRPNEIRKRLIDWYKKSAKAVVLQRVGFFAEELGVQYNKVRIKDQKTRWGSCSQKRNLNFNWHLVMMPEAILDYIVVHELCHLVHMNHSKRFWQLVQSHVPDFREKRLWLKKEGAGYRI